jgi:hypothetical protein
MRIILLHAATTPYKFISDMDRALYEAAIGSSFTSLPTGKIVGLALVDKYDPIRHGENEWYIQGSYGYWIQDVIRLQEPIPCKGRLSLFHVPEEIQFDIRTREEVAEKLAEWEKVCLWGSELRAVSIRQPPIEAILLGQKKIENRSRSICKV